MRFHKNQSSLVTAKDAPNTCCSNNVWVWHRPWRRSRWRGNDRVHIAKGCTGCHSEKSSCASLGCNVSTSNRNTACSSKDRRKTEQQYKETLNNHLQALVRKLTTIIRNQRESDNDHKHRTSQTQQQANRKRGNSFFKNELKKNHACPAHRGVHKYTQKIQPFKGQTKRKGKKRTKKKKRITQKSVFYSKKK